MRVKRPNCRQNCAWCQELPDLQITGEISNPRRGGLVRSRELLNQGTCFCSPIFLGASLPIECVIVGYGSGKELHCLLCIARLNGLNGANSSDCVLAVGTLAPFQH